MRWFPNMSRCNARLSLLCLTALTAAEAPPTQTFVVDAAGGPGVHFTNLGTATATAPSGATLLVRAGDYFWFAIDNKSMTLLCDPGAVATGLVSGTVRNLAAHQTVTIRGLTLRGASTTGQLSCSFNAGTVTIDSCDGHPVFGGRVTCLQSTDVRVNGTRFRPVASSAIWSSSSTVRIADCEFFGAGLSASIEAMDSTIELANVTIEGQGAAFGQSPIELSNSGLRVLGTAPISSVGPFGAGAPVIDGTGSLRIDPAVPLNAIGAPPIGPALTVTMQSMPVVTAATGPAGGVASAALAGPNGGLGGLFLGLAGPINPVSPFADAVLILTGTESAQAIGLLVPGAPLAASYQVPPQPLLRGVLVTWQGASIDAMSGAQISNAVTYVHW